MGEAGGRIGSGLEHGGSSAGVEGEEAGTCGGCGADGSGDGVGDVVELEVEEDVESSGGEGGDDLGAFGNEELQANLDPADGGSKAVGEGQGGCGVREVEGDDEAVLRGLAGSVHTQMIKAERVNSPFRRECYHRFWIIPGDSEGRKLWRLPRRS